jgi:hypothetical protein
MSDLRRKNIVACRGVVAKQFAQKRVEEISKLLQQPHDPTTCDRMGRETLEWLLIKYTKDANAPIKINPEGDYYVDFDYTEGDV